MMSKPKILAALELATSDAAIYTVPANTKAAATAVVFFNRSGGTRTVHLQSKKSGGGTRKLQQYSINQNEGKDYLVVQFLEPADEIRAHADAASVDATVFGLEFPQV